MSDWRNLRKIVLLFVMLLLAAAIVNAAFIGKFPLAMGGLLTVSKPGYLTKTVIFDSALVKENETKTIRIDLLPIRTKNITIMKKVKRKYPRYRSTLSPESYMNVVDSWTSLFGVKWKWHRLEPTPLPLGENEKAIISIERVKDDPGEDDFSQYAVIEGPNQTAEMQFVPGRYTIDITIITDENIKIPKQKRTAGSWPFKKSYTIPEVKMDSYAGGGLKLDVNHTWYVDADSLDAADNVTFYAVYIDLPAAPEKVRVVEDLEWMNKIKALSERYIYALLPSFG